MTSPRKYAGNETVHLKEAVARSLAHAGLCRTHLVDSSVTGDCSALSPGLHETLLLALAECADNTVRHAGASGVRVSITCHGTDAVDFSFADNGRGCDLIVALSYASGGLVTLRRRVEASGGRAAFSSRHGGGFHVFLRIGHR